jgi:ribosomal protein S18 acetylase RimI-like enzyme
MIRPATPADAADLALLTDMAARGVAAGFWRSLAGPDQSPFEVGRSRALREDGDFSYRNAWLATVGDAVAGGLLGYRLADPYDRSAFDRVPTVFRPMVELEAEAPGRWYVNVLAVYPEFRKRGIAAGLLAHADAVGRSVAPKGMAIIVAADNEPALRLYRSAGYRETARRLFPAPPGSGHGEGEVILLTKPHS